MGLYLRKKILGGVGGMGGGVGREGEVGVGEYVGTTLHQFITLCDAASVQALRVPVSLIY